nr:hyaluronidase-like [Lytechinus pictus]
MNLIHFQNNCISILTILCWWSLQTLAYSKSDRHWLKNLHSTSQDSRKSAIPVTIHQPRAAINPRHAPKHHGGKVINSDKIFRAIWNLRNHCGDRFGIELPLSDYGIEFNRNHKCTGGGNVINLFHRNQMGLFPRYEYVPGPGPGNETQPVPVNGGIPQLANITQHLEKAAEDITSIIPDPKFDGVAVIDWEAWRPQWKENFDLLRIYQEKSIAHVKELHPEWDTAMVESVARLEWEQGAKLFMESTLELAKTLRPNTNWGFYMYPLCLIHGDTANMSCTAATVTNNNNVMWLFNERTALYPSIYLRPFHFYQKLWVRSKLQEALRVRQRSDDPQGVIMSYTRFNYSDTGLFYSLEDLNNTILQSAKFGTNGVILWGETLDVSTVEECSQLRSYIINALGPTVVMSRKGAESCSMRICSGNGRCVGDILACRSADRPRDPMKVGVDQGHGENTCSCRCFRGWEGDTCSVRM